MKRTAFDGRYCRRFARSHFRTVSIVATSLFLASCTSALITVIEQVHPNATAMDKQYDVLAEISFNYEGRTVQTQRHFEYYLFRRHRDHRETERFYSMQRSNIISLSENEAARVSIRPAPPPFKDEIIWTAAVEEGIRAIRDSAGRPKCAKSDPGPRKDMTALAPVPGITNLVVKLKRLPYRLGGYPDDLGGLKFTSSPEYSSDACETFMKAGAINTTITPLRPTKSED